LVNHEKLLAEEICAHLFFLFFTEAVKGAPISTPLMEFVRKKRADKGGQVHFILSSTFYVGKLYNSINSVKHYVVAYLYVLLNV